MIFNTLLGITILFIITISNQVNARLNFKNSNTFEEVKIGLDSVSGSVVAFGDFNSDKL